MLTGGEALPASLRAALRAAAAALTNLYGPTETTIWSCRAGAALATSSREAADRPSDLEHAGLCAGRWA